MKKEEDIKPIIHAPYVETIKDHTCISLKPETPKNLK